MKTKVNIDHKNYPYLAVHSIEEKSFNNEEDLSKIKLDDVVLISVKESGERGENEVIVQRLLGGSESFISTHEYEYYRLPSSFSVTLRND